MSLGMLMWIGRGCGAEAKEESGHYSIAIVVFSLFGHVQ
jgi:hypothetical protein